MKKTKKALASLAIAGMTLSMIPFNVFAASPVTRLAGVTAEQTAVQIAEQTGYTGTAILASSTSYGMVDALTAGPLAASLKAPILLTGAGSSLDAATKAELTKLAVKTVYVTSGTAVIKQGVLDELKGMGIEVVTLGGFDRAETSVNIAKKMTGITKVAVANTVVDALSIAAVASAANEPILLTDRDALPASVAAYLAANTGITASDVIGGTGVISDAVKAGLPSATRHAGMTAYDTNNQVIQDFASSLQFDTVYVANGVTGIDALAGAPLAAQTKSPIVLTDGKTVPQAAAFTYSKSPASSVVTALGGEAVVPESVRAGVAAGTVTPDSNELKIVSVSALNDANSVLELVFSKPLTKLEISDITVQNTNSAARYGVKSVVLASSGLVATVELYSHDDADQSDPVLSYLTNYTFTVNANGTTLTSIFNRPNYKKDRITDINAEKRTISFGATTLNVPSSMKFDFQASLGSKVRVWYNSDNDVVQIAPETESPVTGNLEVTKTRNTAAGENGKVELDGVEYSLGDTLVFDHNDVLGGAIGADGAEYDYAKAYFDKNGAIERIVAYDWDDFFVVNTTDNNVAISFDEDELDLEDYIIIKDGKSISVSDLAKGDVVYFEDSSNGGDGVAEVYNKTVTGEIETVYSNKIKIGGKNYTYLGGEYGDAQYLDGDEFKDLDADQAEEFQAGGSVKVYLDRFGKVVYIEGSEGTVESDTVSVYNVKGIEAYLANSLGTSGTFDLELVDEAGDEVSKSFRVNTLDKVTITSVAGVETDYEVGENYPATATEIDEFRLVANGGGGDFDLFAYDDAGAQIGASIKLFTANGANTLDSVMEYSLDDSGNVVGLNFLTSAPQGATDLELDDNYVSVGANNYRLESGTVVYDASEGFTDLNSDGVLDAGEFDPDADDITVTTWGALADEGFDILESDVYRDENGNVDYLVIKQTNSVDKTDVNVVINTVFKNAKGKIVELEVFVDGDKKTYQVDELAAGTWAKGQSVVLLVNDKSQLVESISAPASKFKTGQVVSIDLGAKKILLSDGVTYKLMSGGDVYESIGTDTITSEEFREITVGDTVDILLDEIGTVSAGVITIKSGDDVVAPTSATVSAKTVAAVGGTITVTVNEAIDAASQANIIDAITAKATGGTLAYSWNAIGTVLTITNSHATDAATFSADTVASVKDVAGNTNAALALDIN